MSTTYSPRQQHTMSWSTSFAVVAHLCVLFGFGIVFEPPSTYRPSLEITLATTRSSTEPEPEQADFLAQENQAASGTLDEAREITTTEPPNQPSQANSEATPAETQTPQKPMETGTTTLAAVPSTSKPAHSSSSAQNKIETIEAKLNRQRQLYGRRPRILRMASVATRQSDDALYQLAWQQRVEQVGNRHYPEQARQQRLSGDVRLVVAILPDGSIKEINVLVSSGQALLDQAAIRSVELAAPFAPFPANIREKADILEIIRTWQFRNDVLTSS